jgi:MoaA/NifB/PqqE/SkfB family radical SAM enzyme
MISGPVKSLVIRLIALQFVVLAIWQYRSISSAREVLINLRKMVHDFIGDPRYSRLAFNGRKFYCNSHIPGFPSKILARNQLGELHRLRPVTAHYNRLRILFMSITNSCPLHCKHCYEWDNINKPDPLSTEEYKQILSKFADSGIGQVHLAGGEPMMKYQTLLDLTRFLKGRTEIWIDTSGFGLSLARAVELRKAGLTGAVISVDHFNAAAHNEFRGSDRAFHYAMEATENAARAGLITAWSICATRDFVSLENLHQYATFAASRRVQFIQILEPIPAGKYRDQDVMLDGPQQAILEEFFLGFNKDKASGNKSLITYPAYNQRRLGCLGNGNRYIAIDTWGNMQSCPFCRNNHKINALQGEVETLLSSLPEEACLVDKS